MSKIKNGGLDRYGTEPFEQQQLGTAGVEGVNNNISPVFHLDPLVLGETRNLGRECFQGAWERNSPSGVQRQNPSRQSGERNPPEVEAFSEMNAYNFDVPEIKMCKDECCYQCCYDSIHDVESSSSSSLSK